MTIIFFLKKFYKYYKIRQYERMNPPPPPPHTYTKEINKLNKQINKQTKIKQNKNKKTTTKKSNNCINKSYHDDPNILRIVLKKKKKKERNNTTVLCSDKSFKAIHRAFMSSFSIFSYKNRFHLLLLSV